MNQEQINGIAHEVNFWRTFVDTERFRQNWASNRINPELEQEAINLIGAEGVHCSVLDVGSGPVSILHGLVLGKLTAADPLSAFYAGMFDYARHGIRPPYAVRCEDLTGYFEQGTFDRVHMRNAFDHVQDPLSAFDALAAMVAPGGRLIIHGFENEADAENWQGLHQWNCRIEPGELIVEGREKIYARLEGNTSRRELPNGKTWFTFWI